jgi:O-antigen/teichoic acid export membrane protein
LQGKYILAVCFDIAYLLFKLIAIFLLIVYKFDYKYILLIIVLSELFGAILCYLGLDFSNIILNEIKINIYQLIYPYINILFKSMIILLLIQLDLILVKKYFNELIFVEYSYISTLGKIPIFISGAISSIAFPIICKNVFKKIPNEELVYKFLVVIVLLNTLFSSILMMFSESLIGYLYGDEYKRLAPLLKFYGYLFIPVSVIIFLEQSQITANKILLSGSAFFMIIVTVIYCDNYSVKYNHVPLLIFIQSTISLIMVAVFNVIKRKKI